MANWIKVQQKMAQLAYNCLYCMSLFIRYVYLPICMVTLTYFLSDKADILGDISTVIYYSPLQKYWNSKANSFVFAIHWIHLGLR